MKIKSLILSSVAAVGFSTGAMAADLGTVLTSLDVCDALGISGLTISSDTNCLSITGGVAYSFKHGDYNGSVGYAGGATMPDNDGVAPATNDWDSKVDAWLKFVGTADSSFGPASATIKLDFDQDYDVNNEAAAVTTTDRLRVEEAYVSVGDTTVLMAGRKGSIFNDGDDTPLNWKGLFNSESVDTGVGYAAAITTGGHVIQVTSDLGNGVSVGGALENLGGTGTAVGVLAYAGQGITAHASVAASGVLTGTVANWGIHAGMTGTFDMFKIGAAFAADDTGYWNAMGTASATFDMFTLAASVEAIQTAAAVNRLGFGVSASAEVATGVTINAGFRWFDVNTATLNNENYQAAVSIAAAVTETVGIGAEIGLVADTALVPLSNAYGAAKVSWAPGGGFTSSLEGKYYATGAYSVEFKAAKNFE